MTDMCPHCGFNLARDTPIKRGRWILESTRSFRDGKLLKLSPGQSALLHTVAKAGGRIVGYDAILNRISESDRINLIHVQMRHIRNRIGCCPIRVERGSGLSWDEAA